MANDIPLVFSVPTSGGGSTESATFVFFSGDYKRPRQGRSTAQDIVHNQNGIFKYRYDNGPNVREWQPFRIVLADHFEQRLGASATQQMANLEFLWSYVEGPLGFRAPEGLYSVDWADAPLEMADRGYPQAAGDKMVTDAVINLEEA